MVGGFLVGFGGLRAFCILSGLSVLGFGIGLYPSSLTLLRGTLSHFPVLSGGVGFVGSCATSSLNGSLSSKSSWLLTFFNSNLINCPLVSFLRSFFSISILYGLVFKSFFSIPILYGLVFKLFLGRVAISLFISIIYGLVLSPFWVESLYGPPYPYYMVLSLSPFWVESLCLYPYVYTIVTFL